MTSMPSLLRYARQIAFCLLVAYWGLIALGTHLPGSTIERVSRIDDTWMHMGAYTGLGFLLCWSLLRRSPSFRGVVCVFMVALCYGGLDEVTQMLVPNRSADVMDWIADAVGTMLGIGGYFLTWRAAQAREKRKATVWRERPIPANDAA